MMMFTLYYTSMPSWILIGLTHRNNNLQVQKCKHVTPPGNIILIPNQPVFALSPICCLVSGEEINTNL